jgi:hypothetical protein
MKKLSSGILAIGLAIGLLSFTNTSDSSKKTAGYWFPYNAAGNTLLHVSTQPALTSTDPYFCTGTIIKCSQESSSFHKISNNDFEASGTVLITHRKN